MNKQTITLTEEKLQEIYTNEEFRNQVAYAHGYADKHGNLIHKQTCSYPITYIVTEDQIKLAQEEKERAKKELLTRLDGVLVFIGMGMRFESGMSDSVGNYRVRTEFQNAKMRRFFIEFGRSSGGKLRIDHAIDRDLQDACDKSGANSQPYNNYKGLERENRPDMDYTLTSLLDIVNTHFSCNFKTILIDNYNLSTSDITCKSPAL